MFCASTAVFNVVMKIKIVRKKLLNNEQQNAKRQTTQESDKEDTTKHERATNQDARK
jgi:hypothetical protein